MASIPRDTKQAIKDLRSAGVSQRKTASIVQANRDTVREYEPDEIPDPDPDFDPDEANYRELLSPEVNLALALEEEYVPDDYDPETAEQWQGEGPGSSPYQDETTRDLYLRNDYSDLSPGEFIKEFFDDFEVGVKTKFVHMQGRRANRRGEIPDQDKLYNDLQQMSSGIGNSDDARYIAEEYWAEAQRYLRQTDTTVFRGAEDDEDVTRPEGSWVGPQSEQQGQWVEIPGRGMVYGTYQQGPNGAYQFQPMQPPSQQGGYPGMGQGGPNMGPGLTQFGGQQTSQDSDEIRELREELTRLRSEVANGSDGSDDDNGPMAAVHQLVEMKSALNQLQDDNGGTEDEAIQNLRREIRSVQQSIQQEAQQGKQSYSDPRERVISQLLSRDDLDSDTAMRLAQSLGGGEEDPEVQKKQIDKEVRLAELEQKRDRTENLIESLSGVAQDLGRGIGQALTGNGGQQAQGQQAQGQQPPQQPPAGGQANAAYGQQPQGQQAPQQSPAQAEGAPVQEPAPQPVGEGIEEWECPECGTVTDQNSETPGVACGNCDYSLMACPACSHPVEVPPIGDPDAFACPSCQSAVDAPEDADDMMACLHCEWVGTPREAGPEVVECASCESIHEVGRQSAASATNGTPDHPVANYSKQDEDPIDLETDGGARENAVERSEEESSE